MNPLILLTLLVAAVSANNYGAEYQQGHGNVGHSRRVPHHRQRLHLVPAPETFAAVPVVEVAAPIVPVRTTVVNMEAPVAEVTLPLLKKEHHKITRFEQNIGTDTSNSVVFDTSNGIHTQDQTDILPGSPNPENPSELWNKIQKSGSYSYTSPEGIPIHVSWTADGINGFRAVSSAIPTPVAPIV